METYRDKNFLEEGRHTKILRNRYQRRQNDHFLKKLSSAITKGALKVGAKSAINQTSKSGKISKQEAEAAIKRLQNTPEYKAIEKKTIKAGARTIGLAAILGAGAIAAPALAGGGAASSAAATGAKGALSLSTVAKGATAATGAGAALKKAVEKGDVKGANDILKNINGKGIVPADLTKSIKDNQTVQALGQLYNTIPNDVKKEIEKAGSKQLDTIVANNRTSAVLLPKTRDQKQIEDIASHTTDGIITGKPDLGISTNPVVMLIGVVVVVGLIILFFRR